MTDTSNTGNPQDQSEQLDADTLPGDSDDPTAGGEYPPDSPIAALDYGTTPAEARMPEPIAERVEREVREVDPEEGMRLVEPGADDTGEALIDTEPAAVASEVDHPYNDLSAEEAAVNLSDDPPMGRPGDGYLDDTDLDDTDLDDGAPDD